MKNLIFLIEVFVTIVLTIKTVKSRKISDEKKSLEPVSTDTVNGDSTTIPQATDNSKTTVLYNNDDDIISLLEEKYRFKNDEVTKRFRVTKVKTPAQPDQQLKQLTLNLSTFPEQRDERNIAWAFRSYAVRRIVGGMETSVSMYPYNVAISKNAKHWCGGAIIDEQWVFTAGHCMESAFDGDKRKLQPFVVRAGSSFHNKGGYQARVNKVFFPKDYIPGNADYDYSLVRLDRPMPIGRNIAVLNLPSKDFAVKQDDILLVTGWGSTDESGYGHIPDRIRFVPVPVMTLEECQKNYRFYITDRMLCAGYATGGKDACNHDSGGPAVHDGILLGVVSFGGKQCGDPKSPGVYSRVSEVTEWVENIISNNEAYTVPELLPKIQKARQRENELQRFKARVEDKKNKIKEWLRETLRSPTFIALAKKRLLEVGFPSRRLLSVDHIMVNFSNEVDDVAMDEINLTNLINDRIIEGGDGTESDRLLRTLALHEIMLNDSNNNTKTFSNRRKYSDSMERYNFMTYLSG